MLGEAAVRPTWDQEEEWKVVHRALESIAKRRAALDAEEAKWLREAEALKLWRHFGMVNALDYMERVLGYTPHVAHEKLRVAKALGDLPAIDEALAHGELSYSAVRELSRVATPQTEEEWLDAVEDMNVRQVEELVACHRPGDRPTETPDPRARMHDYRLRVNADTYAELRALRTELEEEHGSRLDDNELAAAIVAIVRERLAPADTGRARAQIALTICEKCKQGWQHGGGLAVPVDAAAVARAECDAQYIGSVAAPTALDSTAPRDAPTADTATAPGDAPTADTATAPSDAPTADTTTAHRESPTPHAATAMRARQDIPPATARFVRHRDHGRCRVPGCRSAHGIDLHHIRHREHGGTHDPENIVSLCSSCHIAHHEGRLSITGTASKLIVRRSHVGPPSGSTRRDALAAPVRLGWKSRAATDAVDRALDDHGDAPLDEVLPAALRQLVAGNTRLLASYSPRA